jgi:hypothetical protein
LEVLRHMGFGRQWRNWISIILSTSTKILLNGQPGRRIYHVRGLRQGDPLSPLLFVLTMEVLNHVLRWVEQQHFLTPLHVSVGDRASLYADDLVLFVAPSAWDLETMKAALTIFGLAFGLFSNLDKSVAMLMHCIDSDIARVQDILSCRIEEFPCSYLGVPLSVRMLKRSEEQPLIDRVAAHIPKWKSNMLNVAGRTALVTATMSAIPVHMSIALCLSPWVIQSIDKLRQAFVWCGSDSISVGLCKVAWGLFAALGSLVASTSRTSGGLALRCVYAGSTRQEQMVALCYDPVSGRSWLCSRLPQLTPWGTGSLPSSGLTTG